MILILRGHIRDSFKTPHLYNLVKKLSILLLDLKIVIHTWNIISNNISWREIELDNTPVTNDTIFNYFGDLKDLVSFIMIDDDSKIKLIGNVNGNINNGPMKLIGWKNYWYGKFKIIDHFHDKVDKNEPIINCRFDVMNNSNSFDEDTILSFIMNNRELNENVFLFKDENHNGIDNIYMGNSYTMHRLCYVFHHHLDEILLKHNDTPNQEKLVFRINRELF